MGSEPSDGIDEPRSSGVRNEVSGVHAGALVQAGVVHGDIITGAVRSPLGPPAQVPPSTRWWVDRSRTLADWRRLLDETAQLSPSVAVLSGMHGVGKSALAYRMAEEARGRFPGGQIYVNLADWRDEAGRVDVSGALRGCLRSLGVGEPFLPTALPDLTNDFRSLTAGDRVLVVVDEVTEPAQVEPFIPKASGSVVVAVSNGRLAELIIHGARPMPVDPLRAPDAISLLTARCGERLIAEERAAAELLVSWCGGLPLALGVIAGQLVLHPDQSLADLVSELADERGRLEGFSAGETRTMSAALTLAYQNLPPECQRLYRGLALFPGDVFDAELAGVIAEIPAATARRLLHSLYDGSMLTAAEDAHGRYRFHELVRLHAVGLAAQEPTADQTALARRVTHRYVRWIACADRALMGVRLRISSHEHVPTGADDPFSGQDGKRRALAWLSAERTNALAVLRGAVARGFFAEAWQMAEALSALYLHHREVRDWIESAELGIMAASRDGDLGNAAARARLRCLLSRPLLDLGEVSRARAELETAVAEADTTDNLLLRASAREFQGRAWEADDPPRAIALFQQAAELSAAAGSRRGVALAHFFTGCAETADGRPERALSTLASALRLFTEEETGAVDRRRMAGRVRVAMGMAHRAMGRTAEAKAALADGADDLRAEEAAHYELPARECLAEIAEAEGDTAAVRVHLGRALEILEGGRSPGAQGLRERIDALGAPD
ncbi:tetratricopeptide repeat protein [Streptomyces sp. MP131-18]|uniref:tetratricopeptide repeat protein n=1 Tax=Streptomyces sp. MP131-18 TaxID=1857892 RepID=UPI00097CA661|nr:tetratricopeptide repeat protein [Streptomyces sp. MP131-18]